MNFGLLRLRRLALRKSVTDIAIECDLPVNTIVDLEKGVYVLTKKEFKKVLRVYKITEKELRK